MTTLPLRLIPGLLGLAACFTLGACKSTGKPGGSNDVVDYTSPPTKLSKEEYPFDEEGNYRPDWIKDGAGKVEDTPPEVASMPAYTQEPAAPEIRDTPVRYTPKPSAASPSKSKTTASKSSSKSGSSGSRKTATGSKSKAKPKPKAAAKPQIVKVAKGDTLTSISRRSGVSISRIKAYNGLKSDFLRDGAILKLPPKSR